MEADPNVRALEGARGVLRAVESFLDAWYFEPGEQQAEADAVLEQVRAALAYATPTPCCDTNDDGVTG